LEDFSSLLQAFINGQKSLDELQQAIDRELETGGKSQLLERLNDTHANGAMDTSTHQLLESLVDSKHKDLETRLFDQTIKEEFIATEVTKKGSNKTLLAAAGLSVVLLAAGGYFFFSGAADTDSKELTDEDQIQQLIAKADEKREEGSLLKPEGNNALHFYQQILKISPQNQPALDGIKSTRELLIERAQILLTQGNTQESGRALETALMSFPNDSELIELQRQTKNAKIKRNSELIGKLIAKAQVELNADQLVTPADNNAFRTLQEAVTLEPSNQNILVGG